MKKIGVDNTKVSDHFGFKCCNSKIVRVDAWTRKTKVQAVLFYIHDIMLVGG